MNEGMPELRWSTPRVRQKVLYRTMLIALLCYGFFQWVLWPVKVVGDSMLPTYRDGTRHFINKLAYWSKPPQRGEVVALRANGDVLIKRIIGLPGETISLTNGYVFVDGVPLDEPYTRAFVPSDWPVRTARLGPYAYYVMGDNRATSVLGEISAKHIVGKVVF